MLPDAPPPLVGEPPVPLAPPELLLAPPVPPAPPEVPVTGPEVLEPRPPVPVELPAPPALSMPLVVEPLEPAQALPVKRTPAAIINRRAFYAASAEPRPPDLEVHPPPSYSESSVGSALLR